MKYMGRLAWLSSMLFLQHAYASDAVDVSIKAQLMPHTCDVAMTPDTIDFGKAATVEFSRHSGGVFNAQTINFAVSNCATISANLKPKLKLFGNYAPAAWSSSNSYMFVDTATSNEQGVGVVFKYDKSGTFNFTNTDISADGKAAIDLSSVLQGGKGTFAIQTGLSSGNYQSKFQIQPGSLTAKARAVIVYE